MSDSACAWCGEPATGAATHGFDDAKLRLPACEAHAALAKRKTQWMPCIIHERFEELSPTEQAAVWKATYWADNVTNPEWPALLGHDDCSPSAKSRLKRKAAGWLMALARMQYLNPEMFAEVAARAEGMYSEQIERDSFLLQTVRMLAEVATEAPERLKEDGVVNVVTKARVWNEPMYEDED